jgi:hypothetical protein
MEPSREGGPSETRYPMGQGWGVGWRSCPLAPNPHRPQCPHLCRVPLAARDWDPDAVRLCSAGPVGLLGRRSVLAPGPVRRGGLRGAAQGGHRAGGARAALTAVRSSARPSVSRSSPPSRVQNQSSRLRAALDGAGGAERGGAWGRGASGAVPSPAPSPASASGRGLGSSRGGAALHRSSWQRCAKPVPESAPRAFAAQP